MGEYLNLHMLMSKIRHSTALRVSVAVVLILSTILWLCFIYSNSLKNGEESGEQSGKVVNIISSITSFLGIDEPISEHFIRKAAHFTEFAVLGLLICLDLWSVGLLSLEKKLVTSALWATVSIPSSALFASADELLQNISENRGPSIKDVLIDVSGALTSVSLFIVFFSLIYLSVSRLKKTKT